MPLHLTIVRYCVSDHESNEDTHVAEVTEDLLPQAKVPLFQRDHVNSKKAQAMRNDQKRQEAKLRMRGNFEYPLFRKDKHQSDIVSLFINVHLIIVKNTSDFMLILFICFICYNVYINT